MGGICCDGVRGGWVCCDWVCVGVVCCDGVCVGVCIDDSIAFMNLSGLLVGLLLCFKDFFFLVNFQLKGNCCGLNINITVMIISLVYGPL